MVEYYDNVGFSVKNSFWSKIGFLSRMNFWRIFYYSAKQNWAPVEHRLTTVSKQVKTIVLLNSKHEKGLVPRSSLKVLHKKYFYLPH